MKLQHFTLSVALLLFAFNVFGGSVISNRGINVFVISIGINDYKAPFAQLQNAVNDATQIAEKVKADAVNTKLKYFRSGSEYTRSLAGSSLPNNTSTVIDSVYTYLLINNQATIPNIEATFRTIVGLANTNDILIFYFGGNSIEDDVNKTTRIIPFLEQAKNPSTPFMEYFTNENSLKLNKLGGIMEQIACDRQLIISEAGDGSSFAKNLISSFFETNPLLSAGTSRNRVILTTTGLGLDALTCNDKTYLHGPLAYYLLNSSNLFDVFDKNYSFQYQIMKQDIECFGEHKYAACYVEKEYQNLFVQPIKIENRGAEVEEIETKKNNEAEPKTYALVIGTNWYNLQSDWKNLKNPINDASDVAKVLKQNYQAEVTQLNNPNRDSLLYTILKYKNTLQQHDKFILFIAGHGYYSNDLSDGFLVTTDSKSLQNDPFLNTYLQMASLNRLVDNLPAKNVFVLFDVCFGATFDLNAQEIDPNRYSSAEIDVSLEEFISRQNEKTSRIFLASGRYAVPDYWNNSLNHSPFASKLIQALESEKTFTSPGKLLSYLEGNATTPILKQFGKHEAGADFLIAVE